MNIYLGKSEDELKAWVESIDDSLNDPEKQEMLARQFTEIYNSVSPITQNSLYLSVLHFRRKYKIRMRACKALMFLALQEVLLQKETK